MLRLSNIASIPSSWQGLFKKSWQSCATHSSVITDLIWDPVFLSGTRSSNKVSTSAAHNTNRATLCYYSPLDPSVHGDDNGGDCKRLQRKPMDPRNNGGWKVVDRRQCHD